MSVQLLQYHEGEIVKVRVIHWDYLDSVKDVHGIWANGIIALDKDSYNDFLGFRREHKLKQWFVIANRFKYEQVPFELPALGEISKD